MGKMLEMPKIQDYIVELNDSKIAKFKVEYSVVLENTCDFVISRKTAKTERILAVLVSKNLYYLKDINTGEVEKLNRDNLRKYLKDLSDRTIKFEEVKWINKVTKDNFDDVINVITDEDYINMCKNEIYIPELIMQEYKEFAKQDIDFLKYIFDYIPDLTNRRKYSNSFFEFVYLIKNDFGAIEASYFVEKYVASPIQYIEFFGYRYGTNHKYGVFWELIFNSKYKLEFRKFIDYLFFEMPKQGKSELIREFFARYIDYLDIQIELYGEIKEQYSKTFETECDMMLLKRSLINSAINNEKFEEEIKKYQNLEFSDSEYVMLLPKEPEEIKTEGKVLNHYLGGYGTRVARGHCGVVFLRKKDAISEPLVTIEVVNDCVTQMQGENKRVPNFAELHFINKWACEKELRLVA
ncbi:MAG: hypothetical protein E7314_05495 [Clostridiales bacterium]|nr:hypothetical protein [Clostridiales bacterium]